MKLDRALTLKLVKASLTLDEHDLPILLLFSLNGSTFKLIKPIRTSANQLHAFYTL